MRVNESGTGPATGPYPLYFTRSTRSRIFSHQHCSSNGRLIEAELYIVYFYMSSRKNFDYETKREPNQGER